MLSTIAEIIRDLLIFVGVIAALLDDQFHESCQLS